MQDKEKEFLVVCLCAAWCGTCREYESGFKALSARYPDVDFRWVDIEDENAGVEDWDVENFPTILIQRDELVLFYGPTLPYHTVLTKMLEGFMVMSGQALTDYAHGSPGRAMWQADYNYRKLIA